VSAYHLPPHDRFDHRNRTTNRRTPPAATKPVGLRELTARAAVVCGLAVAGCNGSLIPLHRPQAGLRPHVSVVAAFSGTWRLASPPRPITAGRTHRADAGTAAAQTAFMCVLLAAFDILAASPTCPSRPGWHDPGVSLADDGGSPRRAAGGAMRQHFIVTSSYVSPTGCCGETWIVLDGRGTEARGPPRALAVGPCVCRLDADDEDAASSKWFPSGDARWLGGHDDRRCRRHWSLLSLRHGDCSSPPLSMRACSSGWCSLDRGAYALLRYGILPGTFSRNDVLFWVMWPATGMLVAAGSTRSAALANSSSRHSKNLRPETSGRRFSAEVGRRGRRSFRVALIVVQR